MNIVFFGTAEFSIPILRKLLENKMKPSLIITTKDKPAGRKLQLTPPPAKREAEKQGIPFFQPERFNNEAVVRIQKENPDIFVVAAYGGILPSSLLDIPKKGALNVHPSLLPKYRGPSPVQTFMLEGKAETGVTIMLMDEQIDHGPILAQQSYVLKGKPALYELKRELAELGADLLVATIPQWMKGGMKPKAQNDSEATYTKIFAKGDGRIDWSNSAEYIERQVRALHPWPGAFTVNKKRMKILKASVLKEKGAPGKTFQTADGKLGVYAKTDALIIEQLQTEGGKPMDSREFLLGNKDSIGMRFS